MVVSVCLVFSLFLLSQPWNAVSTSALLDVLAPILSPIFVDGFMLQKGVRFFLWFDQGRKQAKETWFVWFELALGSSCIRWCACNLGGFLFETLFVSYIFNGALLKEDICKEVKCGQGICKPSDNSTIPFECECSPGWKQVVTSDDDNYLKFLPCVIPNCTLNYSCLEAPPPMHENQNPRNESIFDVCRWADCGAGKCETTSLFTHKCECTEGYHNLLNLTFSPCFKECSLGMDCKDLRFGIMNRTSPPPSLSADRSNQANFRFEGSYHWVVFTFALLAV